MTFIGIFYTMTTSTKYTPQITNKDRILMDYIDFSEMNIKGLRTLTKKHDNPFSFEGIAFGNVDLDTIQKQVSAVISQALAKHDLSWESINLNAEGGAIDAPVECVSPQHPNDSDRSAKRISITCISCDDLFSSYDEWHDHEPECRQQHMTGGNAARSKRIKCGRGNCKKVFENRSELDQHIMEHEEAEMMRKTSIRYGIRSASNSSICAVDTTSLYQGCSWLKRND